jgi:hypothetical protein
VTLGLPPNDFQCGGLVADKVESAMSKPPLSTVKVNFLWFFMVVTHDVAIYCICASFFVVKY